MDGLTTGAGSRSASCCCLLLLFALWNHPTVLTVLLPVPGLPGGARGGSP
ncbi:hypothetical protein ACRAWF_20080 [Streptomyces sp. L7]